MNIAAYCRVSTDKSDQLNSLNAQKKFFIEYAEKNRCTLVKLYADEGISGTKIKNRREFLHLMEDARQGIFDMVVVKDISRFARNTVDLLQSIRTLKSLGIETTFLTAGMSVLGQSEFVLTIFGALAQEESANTSKRIKFGKKLNAEKGRVPNMVYGYDKKPGEYFDMKINQEEAKIIRQIYRWYIEEGWGTLKIANLLNEKGLKTKRSYSWSQNAVSRILTNELYTGKIINGKQEISDFLTGTRRQKDASHWLITSRPSLQIIPPEQFCQAQEILADRRRTFQGNGGRHSSTHLLSTIIKCKNCGRSFRRMVRTYKNTYIRWVCSSRNGKGTDSCPNAVSIDEEAFLQCLEHYFINILKSKKQALPCITRKLADIYQPENRDTYYNRKELDSNLAKLRKKRQKYLDLYTEELISRQELKEKLQSANTQITILEKELQSAQYALGKNGHLEALIEKTFPDMESIVSVRHMTSGQLKQIIQKAEADQDGNITVFLCRLSRSNQPQPYIKTW